jgi:hypothetical protein
MTESRIKISSIVENQLPDYVKEEFPLVTEFLSQYYQAIENQGSTLDILQNIDHYIKVDNLTNLIDSTQTTSNVSLFDGTINVESTFGFPDSYGLIKIDNEIITYKSKTSTSFDECVRGFVGIEEYFNNDQLKFSDTNVESHVEDSTVVNLSVLFLKEFFNKIKIQVTPGFENRALSSQINEGLFIKQSKDFYSSKGTAHSFEILFRALYGKDVEVILPRDFLIQPSDAQYRITKDLVVEAIEGNPTDLINLTLYQDSVYDIPASRGTVSNVEKIIRSNKEYYVISLDFGYGNNVNDTGLALGNFTVHSKTKNIIDIVPSSDTITVDSTLGFPSSGNLTVDLENGTQLLINYTSKSSTQFYGCTGINQNVPKNSELNLDAFAYGYTDVEQTKIAKVRITGVLSNIDLDSPTKYYDRGDLIKIVTIGKQSNDFRANKWLFNISSTHNIKSIIELDALNFRYNIDLYDRHFFYIGDSVTIISPQGQPASEIRGVVSAVKNSTSITISLEQKLNSLVPFQIKKNIVNVSSKNDLSLNKYVANVQNTYIDSTNSVYVTSLSLPYYANNSLDIRDKKITFSGTFSGDSLTVPNHKFYTGDKIVYNPDQNENKLDLGAGKYFVRRIDSSTIKLSRSVADLFNNRYLNVSGTVVDNVFYYEPFTFENLSPKTVLPQNLIRQIPIPSITNTRFITPTGFTGIFVNGVELLNYKSNDYVYYGPITSIDILSRGGNYDVINPPIVQISDLVGSGATAHCTVSGSLVRIDVIDGGVNYLQNPEIIITGGNGSNAKAIPILESYDYSVSFSSNQSAGYVNLIDNTIGFSSFHKLNNGDELIYQTNEQQGIGGITTNSSYFASVVDANTIKLHTKLTDAFDRTNPVNLSLPYGTGVHTLKSKFKRRKIQSINVINPGTNYRNRKLFVGSIGISTANNSININNHNFNNKDIVTYQSTGEVISGLDTSKYYYVEKIDDNNFRLFDQYTLDDKNQIDFYYETNQPVNLTSVGSGLHIFRDEPIRIQIIGPVGVTTFANQNFDAELQPIFRGRIESVFLEDGGSNYGTEEIFNYNRQPNITLNSGTGAEIRPVILNGSIVNVFVVNPGIGYNSPPDIFIESPTGSSAILVPIVNEGLLVEVKVVSGGIGYEQSTTTMIVSSAGQEAKFSANIKSWQVNLVERNIISGEITNDDGIIAESLNNKFELEYSHGYAPRSLRRSILAEKFTDEGIIYIPDLNIQNGSETLSDVHSPIIGWAYDGNPIYGPYGYSTASGGAAKLLKSGYSISLQDNRPSLDLYPEGFFIEDYQYTDNGDLDESNGRFCVTPEYPTGTYAYFATISENIETSGTFVNYRRPIFPYAIGDYYHSNIGVVNFSPVLNQDDFDINQTNLLRNTTPYYLNSDNSFYEYLEDPNKIKEQNSKVINVSSGSVTSIDIIDPGENYNVGDQILFDNAGTGGRGAKAYVSGIQGKNIVGISITTLQVDNVELIGNVGISSSQLNLKNRDFLTITGKIPNQFSTTQRIEIVNSTLILSSGIGSAFYTGIVTYMSVYPPINAIENDLFYLGNEVVKILNIDKLNSRVRILRNQKGTTGISSYSAGYALTESPTKFVYNSSGIGATFFDNREFYFNPIESVGLGTTSGVGIGLTLYFSNPGAGGTSIFVPTRTIYIPDHQIPTGTELLYRSNDGSPLSISTDGVSSYNLSNNSIVYSAKISEDLIGISTVLVSLGNTGTFVGVGSTNIGTLLYFTSIGSGVNHSLKSNPTKTVKADLSKNTVNVSTAETHGLFERENIKITALPQLSTSVYVSYSDYNRRLCINKLSFSSPNVDIVSKTITINDHKLPTGQSVVYREITPVGGLVDSKIYYVIEYGKNSIKLAESLYDISINKVVNITSTGSGTISAINPQIVVTKNNTINFDLSDSSLAFKNNAIDYTAFDFNIYEDALLNKKFDKTPNSSTFNVIKNGRIGIDTTASISLIFNNELPNKLYYRLEPKKDNLLPSSKKEIIFDDQISGAGEIIFVDSVLSGSASISGVGSTTFTYTIPFAPPESSYNKSNGIFEYERFRGKGKIKNIYLESGGTKYKSLPSISQVLSEDGKGALLYSNGTDIGSVSNVEIIDIGFSYPKDYTLRPTAKLPNILKLYSLSIFDRIGISSQGINYVIPPDLVVIDKKTNKQVVDVDLSYNLGDNEVRINRNVSGIYDTNPSIIPINNSNGIGINSITYDSTTKNVTLYLKPSYSDLESFPFAIGERILVESVGVTSTTSTIRGYNSENYGFSLFTVTSTDPNIGGSNPSITYNLSEYLSSGESPGTVNLNGFVVPERYLPIFNISLKKLEFLNGETVSSKSASGIVQLWDSKNNNLKIATNKDFVIGEVIIGESSRASGIINEIYISDSSYNVDSYSIVRKGWFSETGFLNKDTQRIQDSDYYQYFSYSLKSEISFDVWEDSVSTLNHTAGFKKFSDLVINSTSGFVGLSTSIDANNSQFTGIADLYSVKSLHCFDDFDLVSENNIVMNNKSYSDTINFKSKILQDYIESIGNRVLKIDDISSEFNSNPRTTNFSVIDSFDINDFRSRKYVIYITDRTLPNEKETILVSLIHDGSTAYLNQYASVTSEEDLGHFDFNITGVDANLLFYPNKSELNNYNLEYLSFGIRDNVSGIGTLHLGDAITIRSDTSEILAGSISTTVVGIASTYRASKVLVQIGATDRSYFEFNEFTLLHDDSNVYFIDYGQLTTGNFSSYSSIGIGTYHAYLNGSELNLDLILDNPSTVNYNINSVIVSIANTSSSGLGTGTVGGTFLESNHTSIASTSSPTGTLVSEYDLVSNSSYYIAVVEDLTNGNSQVSEIVVTNSRTESYLSEYGLVKTSESFNSLGQFDANTTGNTGNLWFTPNANIECEVRIFAIHTGLDETSGMIDFTNSALDSSYGLYNGSSLDVKREFELKHNSIPIFKRQFDGSSSDIVDVVRNTIRIPEHYFITGEEITYSYQGAPIGIETTSIAGIGTTDKLPPNLYIVKVNDLDVQVSASASHALSSTPNVLSITSVGSGTTHHFSAKNQNSKLLLALDNAIQSPIVSTAITTKLVNNIEIFENILTFAGITSFYGGDLIKVDNEIMKLTGVGIGSTNFVTVLRPWMGSTLAIHTSGALISKVEGDFNIVDNNIHFIDPPQGLVPLENPNKFDETDYSGITTSSKFSGRVFLRSGIENSSQEPYSRNYIFNDISNQFNGVTSDFRLTSNNSNVTGVSTSNSIILINGVFQIPSRPGAVSIVGGYDLEESSGISTISFVGTTSSIGSDINISNIPRGGIIVSVGSTRGFGYQPLVSAGGTAVVSVAGTIQSVSIANSGSGYRSGYQVVNVGVGTSSLYSPNIEFIGTATVSGGHVVSVAITNPGVGYTASNPPYVFFDSPLSYTNIPLVHSSSSLTGFGTGARVDIIVGQGSSVISFELKNLGYGYGQREILTIPISGNIGIPTNTNLIFKEFSIIVEQTYNDSFSGWAIGDLQLLDPLDSLFDGERTEFPILINGNQTTIRKKVGSNIDIESTLLIFINDVLQVPGEGYTFAGGSVITFTEPPSQGDTSKLVFYRGTGDVDTVLVDILETIKPGDTLQINSDDESYKQDERSVSEIISSDAVRTNMYSRSGISNDSNLLRPVTWCKQEFDMVMNDQQVTKDRIQYEPYIYPISNIIEHVGTSSTVIYVESAKTFFDSVDEYVQDGSTEKPQKSIKIVEQETLVPAFATAIVSSAGTIGSILISNSGIGYTSSNVPSVIIGNTIGVALTQRATATAVVSPFGTISNIIVNYPGVGYTSSNPPQVLIELPEPKVEVIREVNYSGDFGIIVGYGISTMSGSDKNIFDLYVPQNSFLRDTNIVGTAITLSQIQVGDFFVVQNSNVGSASTNFFTYRNDNSIIGLSTQYVDGIYQVNAVETIYRSVAGVGSTYVKRIFAIVEPTTGISTIGLGASTIFFDSTYYTWDHLGITTYSGGTISTSNYFGDYSWGKISGLTRFNSQSFTSNGFNGISTSPSVIRLNPLKYENYTN